MTEDVKELQALVIVLLKKVEELTQEVADLLEEKDKDQELHADSAYIGEEQEKIIAKYEMKNKVHEKGYRNNPLTNERKKNNTEKSKIRARVEHVFGFTCLPAGGAKYEQFSTKIGRHYKSNRDYWINQLNLQLV